MTTHTLRLIDEYLTQGGYAPNIDADTLDREAVLVAAAPDMLAALSDIILSSDANCGDSLANTIEAARSIITKATGA